MSGPSEPPPYDPSAYQSPPGYNPLPAGYYPPSAYGAPPYGGAWGYAGSGYPGKLRPTGVSILLFVCTLGIYGFVYNYSVHNEMRRYSGRGIGGGIALLLSFIANVAMPFVTASEVGSLYSRRGERPPVTGWTGLWLFVPAVAGYVAQIFVIFESFIVFSSDSGTGGGDGLAASFVIFFVVWIGSVIAGAVLWFTKTNNALNAYWQSVGVVAQ
jgi:hypothetical protein